MNADNQQERLLVTKELKWFLAGFIEGEGSLCVSLKAHPTAKYGYYLDPEFFLYQHKCGIKLLHLAQEVFGTGRISPKSGNENVLVFSITSRKSIYEKMLPFFEKHMRFSAKWETYIRFKEIVLKMEEEKAHFDLKGFIQLVKLAYEMNPDPKRTLSNIIKGILRDHTPKSADADKIWSDLHSDMQPVKMTGSRT